MIDEAKETYQINLFLREELRWVFNPTRTGETWSRRCDLTRLCSLFDRKIPIRNVYTQNGGSIPQSSGLNDESEAFAYIQSLVQNIESVILYSINLIVLNQ